MGQALKPFIDDCKENTYYIDLIIATGVDT